ncbi:MAG: putative porin [Candidatus Polarisedimenticolia bacterium]
MLLATTATARADLYATEKFVLYGDTRFRVETDWNGQQADGVPYEDRTRLRARLRVGFRFDPNEHWQAGARVRTGDEQSQQSSNITLLETGGNESGPADFDFDLWYLMGKTGGFEAWAGRNELPFWKQDELLFDSDVTMMGAAAKWSGDAGPGKLSFSGGLFSPPVGTTGFSGTMAGAQAAWQPELAGVKWAFAAGVYGFNADPDNPEGVNLLDGNGSRDYLLLEVSLQARFAAGGRPLVLGADVMHNVEGYADDDPDTFTAENFDQVDGYVLLATWGSLDEKGQWLVGWYHARIQTFAVQNSYAEDDWVRWGSNGQIRASNMVGDELRFGWAFNSKMNLLARYYRVEAITTVEDGMRARVDFNYTF